MNSYVSAITPRRGGFVCSLDEDGVGQALYFSFNIIYASSDLELSRQIHESHEIKIRDF